MFLSLTDVVLESFLVTLNKLNTEGNYRNIRKRCEICSKFRRSGFFCQLWTHFTFLSSVSIADFEQVNDWRVRASLTAVHMILLTSLQEKTPSKLSTINLFKVNNRNTRKKMWNLLNVDDKLTRATSLTSFWCVYRQLFNRFSTTFSTSI